MTSPGDTTRWWWIRHAPVPQLKDRLYGNTDPDCDTSNALAFRSLADRLPRGAVWVVTALRRTHQTAHAIESAGYPLPPLIVEADLGEQSFGDLHGVLHVDHSAARADGFVGFWPLPPDEIAPGGESLVQVRERVVPQFGRLSPRFSVT